MLLALLKLTYICALKISCDIGYLVEEVVDRNEIEDLRSNDSAIESLVLTEYGSGNKNQITFKLFDRRYGDDNSLTMIYYGAVYDNIFSSLCPNSCFVNKSYNFVESKRIFEQQYISFFSRKVTTKSIAYRLFTFDCDQDLYTTLSPILMNLMIYFFNHVYLSSMKECELINKIHEALDAKKIQFEFFSHPEMKVFLVQNILKIRNVYNSNLSKSYKKNVLDVYNHIYETIYDCMMWNTVWPNVCVEYDVIKKNILLAVIDIINAITATSDDRFEFNLDYIPSCIQYTRSYYERCLICELEDYNSNFNLQDIKFIASNGTFDKNINFIREKGTNRFIIGCNQLFKFDSENLHLKLFLDTGKSHPQIVISIIDILKKYKKVGLVI